MFSGRKLLLVAVTAATIAAACSSSKKPSVSSGSTTSTTGGSGSTTSTTGGPARIAQTYTIGVLTDLTGLASSGNKTSGQGVHAGAVVAVKDGYTINYVLGDTQTTPAGALSAAQKMVTQDHVIAVISVSALAFGAAPYLTAQGVPVIGVGEDGPEWTTSKNMFSVFGFLDSTKVATTTGEFFKMAGASVIGALGYGVSPQSAEAAKGAAASAETAGLRTGYVNANFPFGSTNVEPIALAMKNAGVDGFTATVDPNTGFSLITALRQLGHNPKVALLPTGYGGDLLQAGPNALQVGQGVYFSLSFEPAEMHTPATEQFQAALRTIGITDDPTYAEYAGYVSVSLLVEALKAAGASATRASLIDALAGVKQFDAAGLLGSHTFDLSDRTGTATGVDSCLYITKLSGSTFQLVPGADPICGSVIPGKTVSPSS